MREGLNFCCRNLICLMILLAACSAAASDAGLRFAQADRNRPMIFPRDHGKHPDFQTEWWYFTGNLDSDAGKWGFQLTFFRRSLLKERPPWRSAWAVRDLYPAHFALTDVSNSRFFHTDSISREGPGLAGAAVDNLDVHAKDWIAVNEGEAIRIKAFKDGYALDLLLNPEKEKVLHGDAGYSRKGDAPGQASHYYSFTRLKAEGALTFSGETHKVSGAAWMDHEFGSSILLPDQVGWDWFSLQLDDGSELMVFHLRRADGSFERPFGTFVPKQGGPIDLEGKVNVIKTASSWNSPRTGAVYPSGWSLEVPSRSIALHITPLVKDQEITAIRSTQVTYWEGAVEVKGLREGKTVTGRGYVELTGYAHPMGGRL